MPPKAAPAAISENESLLTAVLKQVEVKALDYEKIAAEIGAPNKQAAAKRWQRYYKKLMDGTASPGTPAKASTSKAAAPKKAAGPKKAAAKGKAATARGPAGKKRKVEESDIEEDAEGDGDEQDDVEPATPAKKKVGRKATKSAEVVEEDEDMEDELAEDVIEAKDGEDGEDGEEEVTDTEEA